MTSAFVVLCMFTVRANFQSRQLRWLKCLKWLKCLTVCLLQMLLYFYSLITLFKAGFPLSKKKIIVLFASVKALSKWWKMIISF